MRNNANLKSLLNRQFVTMDDHLSVPSIDFEFRGNAGAENNNPRISFKRFGCAIPSVGNMAHAVSQN